MLQRWHHAPRWVVSIVTGAVFTAVYAPLTWLIGGGSVRATVIGALVAGVFFGAVMGRVSGRLRPTWSEASSAATPAQHRAGLRASRGGSVPADAVSRGVAADVLGHRLAHARRWRRLELAAVGAAVVLYAVLAVVATPWSWLGVALFAGFLAVAARQGPERLSRRLAELTAAG